MKRRIAAMITTVCMMVMVFLMPVNVLGAEADAAHVANDTAVVEEVKSDEGTIIMGKAMAAAIVVGVVGAAGAIAMGMAIAKSNESMARQPEMAGKINSSMMLGLVFIETAIIYALIIAILVIFVL